MITSHAIGFLYLQIRLKLNQAFSALRKPAVVAPQALSGSDGEDDEKIPDPDVLEDRLRHCTTVKEHAVNYQAWSQWFTVTKPSENLEAEVLTVLKSLTTP